MLGVHEKSWPANISGQLFTRPTALKGSTGTWSLTGRHERELPAATQRRENRRRYRSAYKLTTTDLANAELDKDEPCEQRHNCNHCYGPQQ